MPPLLGHLDPPQAGRELVGWVFDPARPALRLRVAIHLDGELVREREASNFRPDLLAAGIGDGRHAFSVELPPSAFDGRKHLCEVRIDGDLLLECAIEARYVGTIEDVSEDRVRFSLLDESRPGEDVVGELFDQQGFFLAAGRGPEIRLPRGFELSRVERLELRVAGAAIADWTPVPRAPLQAVPPQGNEVQVLVEVPAGLTSITAVLRTLESLASAGNEIRTRVLVRLREPRLRDALVDAGKRLGFLLDAEPDPGLDHVSLAVGSLVQSGWVDRLRRAAYADARVATASPLVEGPRAGLGARALDALAQRLQPGRVAEIGAPSAICHYRRRDGGGSLHLLAGDVVVEALLPLPPPEDRDPAAHALRRTLAEQGAAAPSRNVAMSGGHTLVIDGWRRYETLAEAARFLAPGFTVDSPAFPGVPQVAYEVEIRDYSWLCPRADFIDETGRYCGEPQNPEACERCWRKLGPRDGDGWMRQRFASVAALREHSRKLLEGATLVRGVPDEEAAARLRRYAPGIRFAPLSSPPRIALVKSRRVRFEDPGTAIARACLWDALKRELPLDFCADGEVLFDADESVRVSPKMAPVGFHVGAAVRILYGLPASRINDILLRELGK